MSDRLAAYQYPMKNNISVDNFEYEVLEKDMIRVTNIKKLRRAKAIDRVKALVAIALVVYICIESILTVGHNVNIHHKEAEIQKYETILANKKKENEELLTKLEEIVVDKRIREKAILELSMMLPSKKNIIYFHKNDVGYVHYDK